MGPICFDLFSLEDVAIDLNLLSLEDWTNLFRLNENGSDMF